MLMMYWLWLQNSVCESVESGAFSSQLRMARGTYCELSASVRVVERALVCDLCVLVGCIDDVGVVWGRAF